MSLRPRDALAGTATLWLTAEGQNGAVAVVGSLYIGDAPGGGDDAA